MFGKKSPVRSKLGNRKVRTALAMLMSDEGYNIFAREFLPVFTKHIFDMESLLDVWHLLIGTTLLGTSLLFFSFLNFFGGTKMGIVVA